MNYTSQQEIYDTIKKATNSNLWTTAGVLAQRIKTAEKERDKVTAAKKKEDSLNTPTIPLDATDEELRTYVRRHLLVKLSSGDLSASEIGQLKDIFNLSSQSDELQLIVENYKDMIVVCPHCETNVHKPIVPDSSVIHTVST